MQISPKYIENEKAWYWKYLSEFRSSEGRSLEEIELERANKLIQELGPENWWLDRWKLSPKPFSDVLEMIKVVERFFPQDAPLRYLEFGCCFGTTFTWFLKHFHNAMGVGLEVMDFRYEVSRWLLQRMEDEWNLKGRWEVHHKSVMEMPFSRHSFDIVFMDTNHMETDYEYIIHLIKNEYVKPNFLFLGDDPFHTGTKISREKFIEKYGDQYPVITDSQYNLWYFQKGLEPKL